MTIDEAIKVHGTLRKANFPTWSQAQREALFLADEALKEVKELREVYDPLVALHLEGETND